MIRKPLLLATLVMTALILLLLTSVYLLERKPPPDFYLGGIQIEESDFDLWSETLDGIGMNTTSVTVYAKQGPWNSEWLWFDRRDTAVVAEIRAAKKQGLQVALIPRVLLDFRFPENRFLWHGMIMPGTEAELAAWFDNYYRFVERWASIAEQQGVDMLMLGSELRILSASARADTMPELLRYYNNPDKLAESKAKLMQFEPRLGVEELWNHSGETYADLSSFIDAKQAAHVRWSHAVSYNSHPDPLAQINRRRALLNGHWLALIKKIRNVYSGQISYAANFDNYMEVGFWPKLDFIGINAYFKLRQQLDLEIASDSLMKVMRASWQVVFRDIDSVRTIRQVPEMPVIFTELGYTARRYSTVYPWTGADFAIIDRDSLPELVILNEQPFDYQERAMAIRALYDTHSSYMATDSSGSGLLKGLLYWKFSSMPFHQQYEPFMLHLSEHSADPALGELLRFTEATSSVPRLPDGPLPQLPSGAALAHEVRRSLAVESWQKVGAISWEIEDREAFTWDINRHLVRVTWDSIEATLDFASMSGKAFVNGELLSQGADSLMIMSAWRRWSRAAFWLNPAIILTDFAAELRTIGDHPNRKGLEVTIHSNFDGAYHWDMLPGDQYHYRLGPHQLPDEIEMRNWLQPGRNWSGRVLRWERKQPGMLLPAAYIVDGDTMVTTRFESAEDTSGLGGAAHLP